ncbi:hypothetical protein [Clostridium sp. Marseille-Q2269]|uniref:hypothetical protein n=1 Tax=Clostridium sp. Marseille-Q2269 TaxID=2942205 RepID=UPI002073B690|nr:hypothetical protein [Clostridium sp. Marseille-Q2269]
MGYNIIDLIDRSIDTGNNIIKIYIDMNKQYDDTNPFSIFSKIFMKYEKEKISYYNFLKTTLKKEKMKDIDIYTYDKISSLIAQFNNKILIKCHKDKTIKEFIEYILDINKDIRALFIDIRGRMIQKNGDGDSYEYEVLTNIIKMEEKYIRDLEQVM